MSAFAGLRNGSVIGQKVFFLLLYWMGIANHHKSLIGHFHILKNLHTGVNTRLHISHVSVTKTDSPKNCPLFLALLSSFGFSLLANGQSSSLDFRHLHISLCLLSTLISNCTTRQTLRKKGLLDFISDL